MLSEQSGEVDTTVTSMLASAGSQGRADRAPQSVQLQRSLASTSKRKTLDSPRDNST